MSVIEQINNRTLTFSENSDNKDDEVLKLINELNNDELKSLLTYLEETRKDDIRTYLTLLIHPNITREQIIRIITVMNIHFYNELAYMIFIPYESNVRRILNIVLKLEEYRSYLKGAKLTYDDWERLYELTYNSDVSDEIKREYLKDHNFPQEIIELVNDEMKHNAKFMKHIADDYHNLVLRNYFKINMKCILNKISPRPNWLIKNTPHSNPDSEVPYIPINLMKEMNKDMEEGMKTFEENVLDASTNILFENVLEDLYKEQGELTEEDLNEVKMKLIDDFKDEYNKFYAIFAISTIKDKMLLLKNIEDSPYADKEIYDDTEDFQMFGPINPCWDDNNHGCHSIGGCRMFLCNYAEPFNTLDQEGNYIETPDDEIMEEDINYWFSGRCNTCNYRILYPEYCLRLPLEGGSWRGCYCSFECLDKVSKTPKESIMVNIMREQIYTMKIKSNH